MFTVVSKRRALDRRGDDELQLAQVHAVHERRERHDALLDCRQRRGEDRSYAFALR